MATDTIPASWRRPTQPGIRRRSAWALASAPLRSGTTLILVVASSLLVVSAVLHLHLWASGYRAIPTIGPLFLAQGIATPIIAVVLVLTRWLVSVAAAAATMIATIGGFVLADTVGLFGFHDGFAAPFASISFGFEVTAVGLLLIGGALVVRSSLNARRSARKTANSSAPSFVARVSRPPETNGSPLRGLRTECGPRGDDGVPRPSPQRHGAERQTCERGLRRRGPGSREQTSATTSNQRGCRRGIRGPRYEQARSVGGLLRSAWSPALDLDPDRCSSGVGDRDP